MSMDDFIGAVVVILFAWTLVLLWATWQLTRLSKELQAERRAVRHWQRLYALAKRQNVGWQ